MRGKPFLSLKHLHLNRSKPELFGTDSIVWKREILAGFPQLERVNEFDLKPLQEMSKGECKTSKYCHHGYTSELNTIIVTPKNIQQPIDENNIPNV